MSASPTVKPTAPRSATRDVLGIRTAHFPLAPHRIPGSNSFIGRPDDWAGLRSLPEGVDAVVSLCRVGNADLPSHAEQIDVRLIDQPGGNDNLDFVLLDTVRTVAQLRREGRTVLIHCVQAQSRTPTVAALYGARLRGYAASASLRPWLTCVVCCRTLT